MTLTHSHSHTQKKTHTHKHTMTLTHSLTHSHTITHNHTQSHYVFNSEVNVVFHMKLRCCGSDDDAGCPGSDRSNCDAVLKLKVTAADALSVPQMVQVSRVGNHAKRSDGAVATGGSGASAGGVGGSGVHSGAAASSTTAGAGGNRGSADSDFDSDGAEGDSDAKDTVSVKKRKNWNMPQRPRLRVVDLMFIDSQFARLGKNAKPKTVHAALLEQVVTCISGKSSRIQVDQAARVATKAQVQNRLKYLRTLQTASNASGVQSPQARQDKQVKSNQDRGQAELTAGLQIARAHRAHMCSEVWELGPREPQHWIIGFSVPEALDLLRPLSDIAKSLGCDTARARATVPAVLDLPWGRIDQAQMVDCSMQNVCRTVKCSVFVIGCVTQRVSNSPGLLLVFFLPHIA
jgi:hypothetical protein